MIQNTDPERRPPLSPQLAVRVAVLGGIALTMFALIFFRLWFLQVLSGDRYLAQAQDNQERRVELQSPRGTILDRNGAVLVDNRAAVSVQAVPSRLPEAPGPRRALFARLARVLDVPARPVACPVGKRTLRIGELQCAVEVGEFQLPFSNVVLEPDATRAQFSYLFEHASRFPGITAQPSYLRRYPYRGTAAQLFGTVGQVNRGQLDEDHYAGVRQGTVVGQSGIEYFYDRYLRGQNGFERIAIDALGNPKRFLRRREPRQGQSLRLSLDLGLQRAGQNAVASVNPSATNGAAFVALDPRNGEVLALGSAPTFDPNVFAKPITQRRYRALFGDAANYPQVNRAISGSYPTGSTFKVVTGTAAVESGAISTEGAINDPGSITIGSIRFQNAGGVANGPVALRRALQVSSDVYFYSLGAQMNSPRPRGGPLQAWARRYGIGRETGIDLPGELDGTLPSPGWRARRNALEKQCRKRRRTDACGLSDLRPWSVGDNVNTSVGQGDVLASPLQMAVAYAAIANGGRIVRPHLGLQVEDSLGKVLQRIEPRTARRIPIAQNTRQAILDGLRLAASAPGGTSTDVFSGFPRPVYGKTGTAERPGQEDQSWYVAYVPDAARPIVVAVTVERGGFGAEAAAPAARLILSHWFRVRKQLVRGSSQTR